MGGLGWAGHLLPHIPQPRSRAVFAEFSHGLPAATARLPPSCLQLQSYLHVSGKNRMRQRTYRVNAHVRYGFTFSPTVRAPAECR